MEDRWCSAHAEQKGGLETSLVTKMKGEHWTKRNGEEGITKSYMRRCQVYTHSPFPCGGSSLAGATQADLPHSSPPAQLPAQERIPESALRPPICGQQEYLCTETDELSIFALTVFWYKAWLLRYGPSKIGDFGRERLAPTFSGNLPTFAWVNQARGVQQRIPI